MLDIIIQNQPDDETCGPTSLQSIYNFYGHDLPLSHVIRDVERSYSGGTLASMLGIHALSQGFSVTLYINNLVVFDPTWFENGEATAEHLSNKLILQTNFKGGKRFVQATQSYLKFLDMGGKIRFVTLDVSLLQHYFSQNCPLITGLSATYLYQNARERYTKKGRAFYDDLRGTVCGHFVVLCGMDPITNRIVVADPHRENPISHDNYYKVDFQRLINAIMLGVLTFDANLLVVEPNKSKGKG